MIRTVAITGFRGIPGTVEFAPEQLTILTGRNGFGKTTFFDAVDWCLFGASSRLGWQPFTLRNLYAPEVQPSVKLLLTLGNSSAEIVRTEEGITLDGEAISERELAETLIVDADIFPPYMRDLSKHVRTVTYLPQEQIRAFVGAASTSERQGLLSGLLGVQHAGLVASSIRRVKENFLTRERNLAEEIDRVSAQLSEFETTSVFDPSVEDDVAEFIASIREQYSMSADDVLTARRLLGSELEKQETSAAAVDATLVAYEETVTTIVQINREIKSAERHLAELQQKLADLEEHAKGRASTVEAAEGDFRVLSVEADESEKMLNRFANALVEKQRAERVANDLADLTSARQTVSRKIAEARKSHDSVRAELEAALRRANQQQLEANRNKEREGLEARRKELGRRLADSEERTRGAETSLRAAEARQSPLTERMAEASVARKNAAERYERLSKAARRAAHLADLRRQLLDLVDSNDSNCPVCGVDHGTPEALRKHANVERRTGETDEQLQDASRAVQEADEALAEATATAKDLADAISKQRAALEELNSEVSRLRVEDGNLERTLTQLGQPQPVGDPDEMLGVVSDLRLREQAELSTLSRLEDEGRQIESRRAIVLADFEAPQTAAALAANVSAETLADVRTTLSRTKQRLHERSEALRDLRSAQGGLELAASELRAQLAAVEGRLRAEHERRDKVSEGFERRCESVGLVGSPLDLATVRGWLDDTLKAIRDSIETTRTLIARATAIERRQIINDGVVRYRGGQKQLVDAQQKLEQLQKAKSRFDVIADGLERRSKSEADAAGEKHLSAIQEFIDDLYPHRHLNEVVVDFSNGEFLLKDRWVRSGVHPEYYSSTGQANVLALSVFLGLALRQTFSRTGVVLLDEPVQNLDDLHFLAFLTLIKRIALSRQVIMSTADSNVAAILRRQLHSWSAHSGSWCEYEWKSFDPLEGPTIDFRVGRRIAAA